MVFMTFWKYPAVNAALAVACFVIFTELFPKNYVQGSTGEATIRALSVLRAIYWGGFIVLIPLNFVANLLVRVFGGKVTSAQDSLVSPEVLETLDNVADSQEILEPDDREMISRILDLPDKVATRDHGRTNGYGLS